ncbi:NAD(P)-dependent oxidoreductase [Gracilibacillus dipsosauri]|uniref:NAD(P)-dependent oxidoreductase n=1 Tax=Gracilibacillus dipsosauri TaxID=178340 RepID=UPI002409FC32
MTKIPMMVSLSNKKVVIIGGGQISERKTCRLVEYGIKPTLISPSITERLRQMIQHYDLNWIKKECSPSDLPYYDVIIIATNCSSVNQMILDHKPKHAWVNATHHASKGEIEFPIALRRGKLQIAISTGGSSPILAKKIKAQLEHDFPEDYDTYIDFLHQARSLLKQAKVGSNIRIELLEKIVNKPIYKVEEQKNFLNMLKEQYLFHNKKKH